MSGLMSLLNSDTGEKMIGGLSDHAGTDRNKTAALVGMALPLLMGAMKKNARNPQTADGLMNAVNSGRHDGSILDNLDDLFAGGVNEEVLRDGSGILNHVFGDKQPEMENALSQRSGLDTRAITSILMSLAPIALGFLGKQTKQNNIQNPQDLNTLLGSMLGGQPPQNRDMLTSLLDQDGDGSILDDVSDMLVGSKKKKSELGDLMDGLFGG